MTRPIAAHLSCLLLCLAAWMCPAAAQASPRIVEIIIAGDPLADARPVLDVQLGRTANAKTLVGLVRALEALPSAGAIDLKIQTHEGRTRLTVVHAAGAQHVGRMAVRIDDDGLTAARSHAMLRRVDVSARLSLRGGRRFHPYLLTADRAALTRWYTARGFREVQVDAALVARADLVDVGWQIHRGDRYVYATPQLTGLPKRLRQVARRGLTIQAGAPTRPADLDAERDRLRAVLCRNGYPRAEVIARETIGPPTADAERAVRVHIDVDPGPRIRTGAVNVAGRFVPQVLMVTLPLREGDGYCPAFEEAARERLMEYLSNAGVPNPRITVHRRMRLQPDGARIMAVTFDVRRLVAARVAQIWFVGNRVTQTDVLRQLTAISEGDRYQQSLVDESVQAMRRSGLFRRVQADVIEGRRADRVSVRFRVIERVPFRVDPVRRSVTLYNMDLSDWPEDRVDLSEGFAFRGAGQRLDLYGKPESLGFRWLHAFLGRYLLATVGFRHSKSDTAAFEETWTSATGGMGLKTATNSLSALLIGELVWHASTRADGFAIDVLDGDALTGALALQLAFDKARRDDERIRYLGLDGRTTLRMGTALAGESVRWADTDTRLTLHLPLWETRRGQHWVLRVGVGNRSVVSLGDADLPGHLRKRPSARGYASSGLGVRAVGPGDEEALLGALYSSNATLEMRIPVPWGRRNGVSPFLDSAAAADRIDALRDDVRFSAGVAVSFSFLQERIEGVVWAAWPLSDDVTADQFGGGFGGSF